MIASDEVRKQTINLADARGDAQNMVLAGREEGRHARDTVFRLEALESEAGVIEVHVPEDLFAVTSSWFLGAFSPSIRKLGKQGFRAKYHFLGKPIDRVINDAIDAVQLVDPLDFK